MEYRQMRHFSYVSDGNTTGGSYMSHTACPHCGEPKPFYGFWDIPFLGGFITLFFCIPAFLFFVFWPGLLGLSSGSSTFCLGAGITGWAGLILSAQARKRGRMDRIVGGSLLVLGLFSFLSFWTAWANSVLPLP